MPELEKHQIEQISHDISSQEITFSHLLEDLIDHVCCDVENEMQKGLNFAEAYSRVKKMIGPRRIKEIQEETLYLVDTKYRFMKNIMKISGVAGTIMFGFAAMFKIQHWPGAGIMMTLGAIILAFAFMPSALVVLWKETHSRKRVFLFISAFFSAMLFISGVLFKIQHWAGAGIVLSLAVISGICFFIPALVADRLKDQENKGKRPVFILGAAGIICYITGMLFKMQHWPGSGFMMVSGGIMLCIIVFPWYTWLTWKEDSHIRAPFIFLLVGSIALIVPGVLINLNLQNSYNEGYYSHQEQLQALFNYRYKINQSLMTQYRDSAIHLKMEQLHSKTTGLIIIIGNIQTKMIEESEGKHGLSAQGPSKISQSESERQIQYKLLSGPFRPVAEEISLLPGCTSRQELDTALSEYLKYVSGLTATEDLCKYNGLLEPSAYLPAEIPESGGISLMSGLHSLELFKNGILMFESYLLLSIASS